MAALFEGGAPCTQCTKPCCCCRAACVTRRLWFGFGLSWWTLRRCNRVRLHAHAPQHGDTPKLFVLAGTPLPNTAGIIALFNVQGGGLWRPSNPDVTIKHLPAYCNGDAPGAQAFIRLQSDRESVATKAAWVSASTGESLHFTAVNFSHVSSTWAASVVPLCR